MSECGCVYFIYEGTYTHKHRHTRRKWLCRRRKKGINYYYFIHYWDVSSLWQHLHQANKLNNKVYTYMCKWWMIETQFVRELICVRRSNGKWYNRWYNDIKAKGVNNIISVMKGDNRVLRSCFCFVL